MLIKNTGNKIVHIGNTMILPSKTGEVSGEMTPPLAALIGRGVLEIVQEKPPEEASALNEPADTDDSKDTGGKDSGKKNAKVPTE